MDAKNVNLYSMFFQTSRILSEIYAIQTHLFNIFVNNLKLVLTILNPYAIIMTTKTNTEKESKKWRYGPKKY